MSLREEIMEEFIKKNGYGLTIPNVFLEFAINKVLDAAVEAGWREVHKMPDKDQRHRSIIDPIFEAINKLRGGNKHERDKVLF